MHPSGSRLLLIAMLSGSAGQALAQAADCSTDALARPRVDTLLAEGRPQAAIDRLEAVLQAQQRCPEQSLDNDGYWLRSDLALAYLKAGREQDCLTLLAPLVDNPRSPRDVQHNLDADARVGRALATNLRLCTAAHEARLAAYQPQPCPDAPDAALDSARIGARLCLALMPATRGTCPSVQLWQDGEPRQVLEVIDAQQATPLADPSRCCSIQTLHVTQQGGQTSLRLQGEGRDCFGGTAYDRIDALYSWQGQQLRPLADYSHAD